MSPSGSYRIARPPPKKANTGTRSPRRRDSTPTNHAPRTSIVQESPIRIVCGRAGIGASQGTASRIAGVIGGLVRQGRKRAGIRSYAASLPGARRRRYPMAMTFDADVVLRLVTATFIGCLIGLNRNTHGKPAGL